jgi:uncharacterized protein YdeI (YjbR/CyaY-like superfamily)
MKEKSKTVQPTNALADALDKFMFLTSLVHDLNPFTQESWLSSISSNKRTANRFTSYSGHSTAQYGTDNSLTLG